MARWKLTPPALLLAAIEFATFGCGSQSPRVLQSISVTPASADAQAFANGQVQFSAVGNYSQAPTPSPIAGAGWELSGSDIATISPSGLAQCNPGASGVVTVKASTSGPCSGTACTAVRVSGSAQLTCP